MYVVQERWYCEVDPVRFPQKIAWHTLIIYPGYQMTTPRSCGLDG